MGPHSSGLSEEFEDLALPTPMTLTEEDTILRLVTTLKALPHFLNFNYFIVLTASFLLKYILYDF